jgi:hypothetical protein
MLSLEPSSDQKISNEEMALRRAELPAEVARIRKENIELLTDFLTHILINYQIEYALRIPWPLMDDAAEWLVSTLENLLVNYFYKIHFTITGSLFTKGLILSDYQKSLNSRFHLICDTLRKIDKTISGNIHSTLRAIHFDFLSQFRIAKQSFFPSLRQLSLLATQEILHKPEWPTIKYILKYSRSASTMRQDDLPLFHNFFLDALTRCYSKNKITDGTTGYTLLQIFCRYGDNQEIFKRLIEKYDWQLMERYDCRFIDNHDYLSPFILAAELMSKDHVKQLFEKYRNKIHVDLFNTLITKCIGVAALNVNASIEIQAYLSSMLRNNNINPSNENTLQTAVTINPSNENTLQTAVTSASRSYDAGFSRASRIQEILRMCNFSVGENLSAGFLLTVALGGMAIFSNIPATSNGFGYATMGSWAFIFLVLCWKTISLPCFRDPSLPAINTNPVPYVAMGNTNPHALTEVVVDSREVVIESSEEEEPLLLVSASQGPAVAYEEDEEELLLTSPQALRP